VRFHILRWPFGDRNILDLDLARFLLTAGAMLSPEPTLLRDEVQHAPRFSVGLREVTILFADLRDFTSWVETTPPEEVADSLSIYLTEMEAAIRQCHGIILQFIGDEIEAVFGPSATCAMHADMAVAASLEMRRRLATLNAQRAGLGKSALRHGIGIHTGTVLASAIGSDRCRFYTLVGDAVNIASRIQELTKIVESDIVLSASTRARLRDCTGLAEIGMMTLRGRTAGVAVYQVR